MANAPDVAPSWDGPNPYGTYQRIFTTEGGIKLIFMVKNLPAWSWWVRVILWGLAMAATLWVAAYASPYPLVPHGCALFSPCPTRVPLQQSTFNLVLIAVMGLILAHFLFGEDWVPSSIEIRPDCMIIDGADVFWLRHMDLGWPTLGYDSDSEGTALRGAYGTRQVTYVILHPLDDDDRTIHVLGAQLQLAMQQLWQQPGEGQ